MAILITGGAGYIGTHTCLAFLEAGLDIVVIDNFHNSSPVSLERVKTLSQRDFPVIKADIADAGALEAVFAAHPIDAVIHFAGWKAVGESTQKPLTYYANNVAGTVTLCQVMQAHDCRTLVFSSSATVYGDPAQVPIPETAATGATNPYGRSKLMVEQILTDLHASAPDHWRIALLRYFNPIGAHPSGMIGEDPNDVPNNLLPYVAQVATGRLARVRVFGKDYPTADGTGVRDYIHVMDLAAGHLQAWEHLRGAQGALEIFNLGTGRGHSVLEIIEQFARISGRPIPYDIAPRRPGDIAVCYADCSRARERLGWEARHGLEQMIQDTWNWQSRNPQGYAG